MVERGSGGLLGWGGAGLRGNDAERGLSGGGLCCGVGSEMVGGGGVV